MEEGRSLAETPTWAVASVVTVMVFVCFLVERSIYRFGKVRRSRSVKCSVWLLRKCGENGRCLFPWVPKI